VACSKKRKADCMNSTTCRWIVGKGCSKKLKTPSPKHLGQAGSNVLQYLDQKNVYFEDLGDCLQDVVVENYLANGAFGVVYAVKYKGKECAMKVVSEKNIDYINYTDMKEAEKEAESLKKASDLGIGPKLYEFRICAVKMPAKFKDKKFYIGVFILEKLDKTLLELMKETIDELKTKNISKERKLVEIDNFKVYLENVADKIIKDCKKAHENKLYIDDLHPGNIMIRKDGSPIISDWGILDRSGRAELICNDVKKEILHVYNWALK
jgi:serine/threonine protein kinase